LIDPQAYAEKGYPHNLWATLRRESPVTRFELPGYHPFWAITKHADICDISKQPTRFLNRDSGIVDFSGDWGLAAATYQVLRKMHGVFKSSKDRSARRFATILNLIDMDPPQHPMCRKVSSPHFGSQMLRQLDAEIAESARRLVDELVCDGSEGECDFVAQVAARHPAHIIARILGLPREDEPFIVRFANEWFGSDDPEFRRGQDRVSHHKTIIADFLLFTSRIIADRRARPREDLASVIANARINGRPMGEPETIGYYLTLCTAGHETTRNAISGGLLALIEHPHELEQLQNDPSLVERAVDEMVRWTSPVNYMTRQAAEDCEVRGHGIQRGDRLVLFYASANRDEDVFEDPFAFRIDRHPNPHLGFGYGQHFCLGAELARKTTTALFAELLPRLAGVQLVARRSD